MIIRIVKEGIGFSFDEETPDEILFLVEEVGDEVDSRLTYQPKAELNLMQVIAFRDLLVEARDNRIASSSDIKGLERIRVFNQSPLTLEISLHINQRRFFDEILRVCIDDLIKVIEKTISLLQ